MITLVHPDPPNRDFLTCHQPDCKHQIPQDHNTPPVFLYILHLKEAHPELATRKETPSNALRRAS